MPKARTDLLKDDVDSLKRKESFICNMDVGRRKVADVKGDMEELVHGLHQGPFFLYASIRQNGY